MQGNHGGAAGGQCGGGFDEEAGHALRGLGGVAELVFEEAVFLRGEFDLGREVHARAVEELEEGGAGVGGRGIGAQAGRKCGDGE